MAEKKTNLPVLTVESTGMQWYDKGAESAYLELFGTFADRAVSRQEGCVNVIGAIPMDLPENMRSPLVRTLRDRGFDKVRLFGMGASLEDVRKAGSAALTIALSPAAIKSAGYLEREFGIPFERDFPGAEILLPEECLAGKRILILHQMVLADALRKKALEKGAEMVCCASWFMMPEECRQAGDVSLREEKDLADLVRKGSFDLILADAVCRPLVRNWQGTWIDLPHFAVSGRYEQTGIEIL